MPDSGKADEMNQKEVNELVNFVVQTTAYADAILRALPIDEDFERAFGAEHPQDMTAGRRITRRDERTR
jgi:hypothetical protein